MKGIKCNCTIAKNLLLLAPKKTDNDVEIVKIVNVFKKIWTIAILMRKDVPNPGKFGLVTLGLAVFEQYRLFHQF